jgi:hypothetical protein
LAWGEPGGWRAAKSVAGTSVERRNEADGRPKSTRREAAGESGTGFRKKTRDKKTRAFHRFREKMKCGLERFTEKWNPVFRHEARQLKNLGRFTVSDKT